MRSVVPSNIPHDLKSCIKFLKKKAKPSDLDHFKELSDEHEMIKFHPDLGMWIRQNWGLWSGSDLRDYFFHLGIYHPDDMSEIILTSFWRSIVGRPIRLDDQIARIQKFWEDRKLNPKNKFTN